MHTAVTMPSAARKRPLRRRGRVAGAAALALLAASALLGGCGPAPNVDAPSGTTVTQDGVAYSVGISRALNPLEPDDRALLGTLARRKGLDGPDTTLVGVFLQAQDDASAVRHAVASPQMVSADGQSFRPLRLPAGDPFAWRGGRLAPGEQLPDPGSAGAEAPQGGAVVVYRVPTDVFITDRPFVLRFGPGDRAASVQLDL
jgi:hypothetical protein